MLRRNELWRQQRVDASLDDLYPPQTSVSCQCLWWQGEETPHNNSIRFRYTRRKPLRALDNFHPDLGMGIDEAPEIRQPDDLACWRGEPYEHE
jgi:hypothetical protein